MNLGRWKSGDVAPQALGRDQGSSAGFPSFDLSGGNQFIQCGAAKPRGFRSIKDGVGKNLVVGHERNTPDAVVTVPFSGYLYFAASFAFNFAGRDISVQTYRGR